MALLSSTSRQKKKLFIGGSLLTVLVGGLVAVLFFFNSEYDILPVIQQGRFFKAPKRVPGTFAEEFGPRATHAELIYNDDGSFTFKYNKSPKQQHAFSGAWFPLENIDIDFSKYDEVEVGIKTKHARRIPFNLSVQNKLETHQYIRSLIEIEKGKTTYSFRLKSFFTPTEWYDKNGIAQIDIPQPDLSKIEALSFESCHLLKTGIDDEFTIYKLILHKDLMWKFIVISCVVVLIILIIWVTQFGLPWSKTEEVIHVPIVPVERKPKDDLGELILEFLAINYRNPNLGLSDLSKEFGKNNQEVSNLLKSKVKMTFPKYLNFIRIEEAKRVLKSGEYESISELGYTVGFNSPSNFARVFKSVVGMSPKEFLEEKG